MRLGRAGWWVAAAAALGGFVALALTRRLNFDEPLALRAGWLALGGVDARPAFVMPWTLLMGALGRTLEDPGAVILACRLAALGAVLGSWGVAARAAGLRGAGLAAGLTLTLCQATFLVHGLEFRYDAAILAGLLLGLAGLVERSPRAALGLGAAAGWLALHHLKGAFFGVGLLGLAGLLRGRDLSWRRVGLGLLGVGGAWALTLTATGLWGSWIQSQLEFVRLAGSGRADPGEALTRWLLRDLGWWALVGLGLMAWARRPREAPLEERALVGLGLLTAGFPLLHPHPWSYMLALPAPFFALLLARRWEGLAPGRTRALAAGAALLCLGAQIFQGGSPFTQIGRGLRADLDDTVATLRAARRGLGEETAALDPAGLLWFARPCVRDWYLDTLFAQGLEDGSWMPELSEGELPADCAVVVDTYRLGMLPDAVEAEIRATYAPAGPLLLRPGAEGLDGLRADPTLSGRTLESYK